MTISVAMINYNNGDFLKTSIESVLAQSRLPDELVICDDGSTDNSWEMAQEFQKHHPFIKLFRNPVNLGASGNRDKAIRMCTSQYVINMDGDDWFEDDVIEKTLALLCSHPDAFVISSFHMADNDRGVLDTLDTRPFCQASHWRQLYRITARKRGIPGNQFAFSKALYERLGGLDTGLRMYEDWDWQIRAVLARVPWLHTGLVGYSYRKSGQGISQINQRKHMRYRLKVMVRNLGRSGFHPVAVWGFLSLFVIKGFKYLSGTASPLGYN